MSIIYDALKKVEKATDKNAPSKEKSQSKGAEKTKPIFIYILVILLGLFAGNMIIGLSTRPKAKPILPYSSPAITPMDVAPLPLQDGKIAPPTKPIRKLEPILNLNGIFFQEDKGYALINNQILNTEDTIQGATVKEIKLNKVVLEFEGREINLINSSR